MDDATFRPRMTAVAEAFDAGRHADARDRAQALRAELLAGPAAADPLQLGWARFYLFKSRHALEDWAGAFALLTANEPVPFAISAKNAGWMFSVGAELAWRLGKVDAIAEFGERCYQQRLAIADPISVVQCLQTVCLLLERAGRPDLNRVWAERLIAFGRQHGADRAILAGVGRLLDHVAATRDPGVGAALEGCRADLARCAEGEFAAEARAVQARLDGARPAAR